MAKANKIKVDFSKMQEGGGGAVRVREGDYRLKAVKAEYGESKSSGNPMITWTFEFQEKPYKGKKIYDRTVLTDKSLWRLHQLLTAMGVKVPKKAVNLDIQKYVGQEVGATIVDGEEYEGKIRSKISEFITLEDLDGSELDEDDEDDEDTDDDDDTEDDDEDLEEMDLDDDL